MIGPSDADGRVLYGVLYEELRLQPHKRSRARLNSVISAWVISGT